MHRAEAVRRIRRSWVLPALAAALVWPVTATPDEPVPARGTLIVQATVQIRNGQKRGSGTIIASVPNETWILTAAHVVEGGGNVQVEIHRFNLGGARIFSLTEGGGWPRLVPATVAATDPGSDVALLRIRGMLPFPFVAHFDLEAAEPKRGEILTSVGVDRGLHLTRWQTTIQGSALVDIHKGGGTRPYTVTTRHPEHGRSGGGLFRDDGTCIGSCTGRVDIKPGQKVGLFASMSSIRRLIKEKGLERLAQRPASKN
jgi:S1-C subfamily serine protease